MKQTIIKESAPLAHMPESENYGRAHMAVIATATARGLCGMYPLPKIGYETCVALDVSRGARLYVANISGAYVVRSLVAAESWPDVFRVTLERFEIPNFDGMNADELRAFYDVNKRRKNRVLRDLASYAINKAVAMQQREQGNIAAALEYERIAESIYKALPRAAQW